MDLDRIIQFGFLLVFYGILIVVIRDTLFQKLKFKTDTIGKIRKQIFSIIFLIFIAVIVVIIFATYVLEAKMVFFDNDTNDISNWVTLTVEIAIGFSIAVIILIYSQFKGKKDSEGIMAGIETLERGLGIRVSPTTLPSGFEPTENDNSSISPNQIFRNLDETIFEEPHDSK